MRAFPLSRVGAVRDRRRLFRRGYPRQVAGAEDGVGRHDEGRQARSACQGSANRVGGPVRLGLADEPEVESVQELLDHLREMARHDRDRAHSLGLQLTNQRRDHRPAVDGQDGFRPALGDGSEAAAFARRHHDRFHYPANRERRENRPRNRRPGGSARRRPRRTAFTSRRASRAASRARERGP